MTDPSFPIVTVTFIAWQRKEALQRGIESCLSQSYRNIEILVIDNSPVDTIHRWLCSTYPMVKSIKTATPISLPAARNLAVATAAGELVFFHDDDSRFSTRDDLKTAVSYLLEHQEAAALALRVQDGNGNCNPQFDGPGPCETYNYVACATLFYKEDFRRAGGYFEDFWLYGEERVMSLGYFGLGKTIHLLPSVTILHEADVTGRSKDNGARYWTADVVMVPGAALLKFPNPGVLFWWPALLFFYTAQTALIRRRPLLALKGLLWHLTLIPAFLRARNPISVTNFHRWQAVRRNFQRAYLKRVGRWHWRHEILPATG